MESHDVVQTSFDRCLATGDFFQTFYDIFLATSPEITSKFAQTAPITPIALFSRFSNHGHRTKPLGDWLLGGMTAASVLK